MMRAMRALALALRRAPASGLTALAEERIQSFRSDIVVAADGSIAVTETIRASCRGDVIKRGILRDIPTRYRDRNGLAVTVDLDIVSVKRDGRDEPYAIESLSNGKRIRIGDKDVFSRTSRRPTRSAMRHARNRVLYRL